MLSSLLGLMLCCYVIISTACRLILAVTSPAAAAAIPVHIRPSTPEEARHTGTGTRMLLYDDGLVSNHLESDCPDCTPCAAGVPRPVRLLHDPPQPAVVSYGH